MFVMFGWMNAPFARYGENLNYVLTVATLVARNTNEAMIAPMVGSGGVCVGRESGGQPVNFDELYTQLVVPFCEISGSHGDEYEDGSLLGYYAV
jgi:hypothetical protein